MAYIASRPVRFDRDYTIGERIPDSVIDPKMIRKLIGMGRIIHISDASNVRPEAAEASDLGGESADDEFTAGEQETVPEGESEDTERYLCEECGREFASERALASHLRKHKK